jgi:hypothetical protein
MGEMKAFCELFGRMSAVFWAFSFMDSIFFLNLHRPYQNNDANWAEMWPENSSIHH